METKSAIIADFKDSDRSPAATVSALTRWLTAGHGETEMFKFIPGITPGVLLAAQEEVAHAEFAN